ncbi:MAG: acyltransferase [Oscillospiraceae bacterium]|nr:acyltransferase [Oscillospiraceae bacterium]
MDVAKALGIIAVMFSHGCGFPFGIGRFFTASYMPLFFVLSGYTYREGRTPGQSVKRRFNTIGTKYFIYSFCLLLMSCIVRIRSLDATYLLNAVVGIFYSSNNLYYPRSVEPNISFFTVQNGPLWYLTCFLISCVIFYPAIYKFKSLVGKIGSIVACVGITILLSGIPIRLPWSADMAFAGAAFMIFGTMLAENGIVTKMRWYHFVAVFAAYVVLCTCNPGIAMSVREFGEHGLLSIFLFFVIGGMGSLTYIGVSKCLCELPALKKVLSYIGKHTLPILGFHVFILVCWDKVISHFVTIESGTALYWINGVLQVAFALVVCLIGSRCFAIVKNKLEEGKLGKSSN